MGLIAAFVAKRLLLLVPILLGASIVVFLLVHLAPGDEATTLLGPLATPLARDELRHHLGLDRPLPVQYGIWLWNSLHLDFGKSINKHQPVATLIIEALKNTLILASASAVFAVVVGFGLGVVAATNQFKLPDRIAMGLAVFLAATPSYWLGITLVVVFSIQLHLFPSGGMENYIEPGGIPDVLYTGNGSDFTSQHLEQVGADLKIRLVFSSPGKPRGRGRIERFFSTVNEMFLCELDGYAPAGGVACRGRG